MKPNGWTILTSLGTSLIFAGLLWQGPLARPDSPTDGSAVADDGHPLQAAYQEWAEAYEANGGDRVLVLPLRASKGLSDAASTATGLARFDFAEGSVTVEVEDIEDFGGARLAAWLVDNQPGEGRSVRPEPGDGMVRLGPLSRRGASAHLTVPLDRRRLAGFHVDLVVVATDGADPSTGGLLFGAPSLFQRLYLSTSTASPGVALAPGAVPVVQTAGLDGGFVRGLFAPPGRGVSLSELVAVGEQLFLEETFGGNGRTCGTCHPPQNNFTLDPAFIATLPPDDPLFVAEYVDALNHDLNGGLRFENPVLMREFGLIVENVDGFGDLANTFTMRSVPHAFALPLSLAPDTSDGSTDPPSQRTGWSGDGAPGSGTLREFAIGAVTQHFTRTLNREPGVDFRLPTDAELDALEAFQLSLGRQEELDLASLAFTDPEVQEGALLFRGQGRDGTCCACSTCHVNGGATSALAPGMNTNFDTGVEDFPHPAAPLGEPMPRDGGFGLDLRPGGGYGNGTFNTPSVVEAADSPPFFHNNAVATVEEAVAFYESDAFNNSPARLALLDNPVAFSDEEVAQLGKFLRVINALDNIREARLLLGRADLALTTDLEHAQGLLRRGASESHDARTVLDEVALHAAAVRLLDRAQERIAAALRASNRRHARVAINQALAALDRAAQQMSTTQLAPQLAARPGAEDGAAFALAQNHPNPFRDETKIRFTLPEAGPAVVRLFDALGREVARLGEQEYEAGTHVLRWRGHDGGGVPLPSGIYFYRLDAGTRTATGQMILVR